MKMDRETLIIVFLVLVVIVLGIFLVRLLANEWRIDTLCKTYGWDNGDAYAYGDYCYEKVVCYLDNVISGECYEKP